ncbi:MAG: hypothetical protein R3246_10125 [Acidimicrobiia bacterium]|nr:hypothetical protein [Acidimicrobiia bacterium]
METRAITFGSRSSLAGPARTAFTGALLLFVITIVIGILNGIDVWEPGHDTLLTHLHSGTLGWITLGVTGLTLLLFSRDRVVAPEEARKAQTLAWAMVTAITLYVAAFLAGDAIFDDRIQRPVFGTLLFLTVIWFLTWVVSANRKYPDKSPARLGMLLAWVSMLIGAVFGVTLGLYIANGEVPGLSDDVAARVADSHPPAMLIGYLLLAGFAAVNWLLHDDKPARSGTIQMWLLFASGVVINIAFVTGSDEQLGGPANLAMIVAAVMLVWQSRRELSPAGWRGTGHGAFARLATLALVVGLALLTVLIYWVITDEIDFDALTPTQEGLGLAFDHTMFIAVMSNVLFGVLAANLSTERTRSANRVLLWGVNVGVAGFVIGLVTTTDVLKQIFTPIMGTALLIGNAVYLMELRAPRA